MEASSSSWGGGSVGTTELEDGSVTNVKLAGGITNDKLAGSITTDKLAGVAIAQGEREPPLLLLPKPILELSLVPLVDNSWGRCCARMYRCQSKIIDDSWTSILMVMCDY